MYEEKKIKPREHLEDCHKIRKAAIKSLLRSIPGEDAEREGLLETPKRVTQMYEEIFAGYEMDPGDILNKTFSVKDGVVDDEIGDIYNQSLVIVKDIPFFSQCEHHMAPFFGKAHIAYIAKDKVVGLSKLARLTECYARRLQVQERMNKQIVTAIEKYLNPLGVMVVLQAEHTCMSMRGIRKPGSSTVTSVIKGVFRENSDARNEALMLMGFKI